ncbi:MAG TPA: hypothetical protein VFE03_01600 [Caulobacteraceae bacterium]|nr:hypothetical protein [Caulobacteraceae bacterium]
MLGYSKAMSGGDPRDDLSRTRRVGGPVHVKLARRLRNDQTAWERRLWAWLPTPTPNPSPQGGGER